MTTDSGPNLPRLCVCERRGRWAAALRRSLTTEGLRIYELRSAAAVRDELLARPNSVIIWELTDDMLLLLEAIHSQRQQFPGSPALVVGDRRFARLEWPLREAGAVHVVWGMRQLDELARVALRHFARVPVPVRSWQQLIEQQLPWPTSRSSDFQFAPD